MTGNRATLLCPLGQRALGKTGIHVFPIGLGGMPLSAEGRPSEEQAIEVILAGINAGVTLIDTADVYCLDETDIGHNERLIRKALDRLPAGRASDVVVATKGGLRRPGGDWTTDGSPAHLREACERSLRALGTDSIALYQFHAPDDRVRFEDSVGELARLQREGKIRHLGLSNVNEIELEAALEITRIETVQNRCNPLQQSDIKNGMIALCAAHEITYLPYSPVGGSRGHRLLAQNPILGELSRSYGASPYQLTLAWLLSKGSNVVPIPGASRPASIQASAQSVSLRLSPEDLAKIDRVSPIG